MSEVTRNIQSHATELHPDAATSLRSSVDMFDEFGAERQDAAVVCWGKNAVAHAPNAAVLMNIRPAPAISNVRRPALLVSTR
jgi:hypothetical protein